MKKKPVIKDVTDEQWVKIEGEAQKRDLREHRALADSQHIEPSGDKEKQ